MLTSVALDAESSSVAGKVTAAPLVIVGASLTAMTVMVPEAVALVPPSPSVMLPAIVLTAVEGASDVFS